PVGPLDFLVGCVQRHAEDSVTPAAGGVPGTLPRVIPLALLPVGVPGELTAAHITVVLFERLPWVPLLIGVLRLFLSLFARPAERPVPPCILVFAVRPWVTLFPDRAVAKIGPRIPARHVFRRQIDEVAPQVIDIDDRPVFDAARLVAPAPFHMYGPDG